MGDAPVPPRQRQEREEGRVGRLQDLLLGGGSQKEKVLTLCMNHCLMSNICSLITLLFKPKLLLMTNEYERSRNPLFDMFPLKKGLNMEGNHI